MKPRHLLLIASIAAFALSAISAGGAFANDRYATPPPLVLSPDLSAPWVTQLQPQRYATQLAPTAPRIYRDTSAPLRASASQRSASGQTVRKKQDKNLRQNAAYQQGSFIRNEVAPQQSAGGMNPIFLPQEVDYTTTHKTGTIIIDTKNKFLYLVGENGKARRYGVGVGKEGFSWKGSETVSRKAEWPSWHPPQEMIARERKKGRILPVKMEGGIANPLGARALYLGNTLYRIHGTNAPSTIGKAVSSGCIRMRNQDVEELYEQVPVGTKVVVL